MSNSGDICRNYEALVRAVEKETKIQSETRACK